MSNFTKADLISAVSKNSGQTRLETEKIITATIDSIKEAMSSGKTVTLIGFGTFTTSQRAARDGRNPSTGQKIQIPAATIPKFRPGKQLREAVNN